MRCINPEATVVKFVLVIEKIYRFDTTTINSGSWLAGKVLGYCKTQDSQTWIPDLEHPMASLLIEINGTHFIPVGIGTKCWQIDSLVQTVPVAESYGYWLVNEAIWKPITHEE